MTVYLLTLSRSFFQGWLRTGDLGYYDEDGEIFVIDRLKDIIRCSVYDVCPSEIENVILSHPGVKEVAVVGQPQDDQDDLLIAFVVRAEGKFDYDKEVIVWSTKLSLEFDP